MQLPVSLLSWSLGNYVILLVLEIATSVGGNALQVTRVT